MAKLCSGKTMLWTQLPFSNNSNVHLYLLVTMLGFQIVSACYVHQRESYLSIEGYSSELLSYNVCVDNTTIHSYTPTRVPPGGRHIFIRRCCGCRVSGAYVREIELSTTGWPRQTHSFYFTDIRQCQCITCNFTRNAHHRYLRELIL